MIIWSILTKVFERSQRSFAKLHLIEDNQRFFLYSVYAILVRGGNFGAAQTMNLIEMILNFAEMNLTDAFLRLAIFILYGLAIIAAFLIGERFSSVKSYIALVIETV